MPKYIFELCLKRLLSIRSTFRGVFVRYCLFWIYDGDMAGDDDDESDLRCLLLRDDMPVEPWSDVDATTSPVIIVDRVCGTFD